MIDLLNPFEMVMFHRYVSLPEGNQFNGNIPIKNGDSMGYNWYNWHYLAITGMWYPKLPEEISRLSESTKQVTAAPTVQDI
jgi:hypothetical protein